MRVVEMFTSIEGEGIRAGHLCTFVRLAGCNLNCSYCDTKQAQSFDVGTEMSVDEIVKAVHFISLSNYVTLTGGEPLCRDTQEITKLLKMLTCLGYEVNIETNGSVDVYPFRQIPKVFFTVDYKCPSSGCSDKMIDLMFYTLRKQDVIKFVVGSREDLEKAAQVCSEARIEATVFVSPVFGEIEPVEIVEFMKQNSVCETWRLQLQLHKFVWDPDMKGV